jgi:hypothetical protein
MSTVTTQNRISKLVNTNGDGVRKERVEITAPNMLSTVIHIRGTAPYLQCRFSQKAINQIKDKQQLGTMAAKGKKRVHPPRDYDSDYQGALHLTEDGKHGIPATAFRQAAMSACRLVDFKMTLLKLSMHIDADGFDAIDGTPLVFIDGKPEKHIMMGRNSDMNRTPDVRVRALFRKWSAHIKIRFDADQFKPGDIYNLFARIGMQVGIGEGRPDSRNSAGMGMGTFEVVNS